MGSSLINLRKCPFCGDDATLKTFRKDQMYFVSCNSCKCMTDVQNTIYEAVQIWNRRTPGGEEG